MTTCLRDKPEVLRISELTGLDVFAVVGRLHALWSWADTHCGDCNAASVTQEWIDVTLQFRGFAKAMMEVGWLSGENWHFEFPNYERHNGDTAKRRALTAQRVQNFRSKNVTHDALPKGGKHVTRHALQDVTHDASTNYASPDASPDALVEEKKRKVAKEKKRSTRERVPRARERPSLEQARAVAGQVGVTPVEAERWWHTREATEWVRPTAAGGTITVGTNWQSDLKTFITQYRETHGNITQPNTGRRSGKRTHWNQSGSPNSDAVQRGEYD